tara:strand:+ start:4407 stop:5087 length:681 start_codon:yes stop_codon:yes gene_type:complete
VNNFIVVIPARGGSKRVPKKNIYPILGKPLILYTLEKIKSLGWESVCYVSSDSDEIGKLTKSNNINFHKRPKELALDDSSTEAVLIDVLESYFNKKNIPDYLITLPPTSPLIEVSSIYKAEEEFRINNTKFDSLMSVNPTKMDLWHFSDKNFERIFPNAPRTQQKREPIFEENSAIYITKTKILLDSNLIFGKKVLPFQISRKEACDINTIEDIHLVEFFMKERMK